MLKISNWVATMSKRPLTKQSIAIQTWHAKITIWIWPKYAISYLNGTLIISTFIFCYSKTHAGDTDTSNCSFDQSNGNFFRLIDSSKLWFNFWLASYVPIGMIGVTSMKNIVTFPTIKKHLNRFLTCLICVSRKLLWFSAYGLNSSPRESFGLLFKCIEFLKIYSYCWSDLELLWHFCSW